LRDGERHRVGDGMTATQRTGLLDVLRRAAEADKADVILHALEVSCAAFALGVDDAEMRQLLATGETP
jgi:hypothetical protein